MHNFGFTTTQLMLEILLESITPYFPKHSKTCLKNVLILSLCLIDLETVCLNRLKKYVGKVTGKPDVSANSHYKRLIRIFDNYAFSSLWLELLKYVFRLFRLQSEYLLLDGTSWKRGQRWHHYLTLCVVYQGAAIPIYWIDLGKHGTSNFKERQNLIKKAMKHFNLKEKTLIADREYIGVEWAKFLTSNEIPFVIRLRHKAYKESINQASGKSYEELKAKALRSKKPAKTLGKHFCLEGLPLFFVVAKSPKQNPKEPLIFLMTNIKEPTPQQIAKIYLIRWKIEHCFKHMKSNGFQLEALNLKGKSRNKLLMSIAVFAYALAIHEGLKQFHKVQTKTYPDGNTAKAESIFRKGINKITAIAISFEAFLTYLIQQIRQQESMYRSPKAIFV